METSIIIFFKVKLKPSILKLLGILQLQMKREVVHGNVISWNPHFERVGGEISDKDFPVYYSSLYFML